MGAYKANRNQDVEDTRTQEQRNVDNFANNVKNAGEVLKKAPHPYAKAAGYAISGLDKVTGGKSSQMLGEVANQATKFSPGGKVLQNASNAVSESGASDAIGNVASKKNGSPTNLSGVATKANDNSSRFSGVKSTFNKATSTNGDLIGSLWAKMPKSLKLKVAVGCGVCVIFLLIGFTIFAQDDIQNLSLTNNTALHGTGSKKRKCTDEEIVNKLIYVGDSRTVGLELSLGNDNITYIAKGSMGLSWLKNTASPELDKVLQDKTNGVVVLALGINDLYNIDNYISYYKELIAKYPSATFYVLSVNPVDEAKARSYGYTTTNASIEAFNKKLSDNFPDNYMDTYSSLTSIGASDGLHYDVETYKTLNNLVISNISSSGKVMCGGGGGDLIAKLEELGTWYTQNVNTYQTAVVGCGGTKTTGRRKKYDNPYTLREYGDDCTEFTAAYMDYVCGMEIPESWSGGMVDPNGSWAKSVEKCGWIAYTSDEVGELQPGDILISHSGSFYSTKGQHGEVYVDESHSFGWGSRKCEYPTNKVIEKKEFGGHVHFMDSGHDYITIYRYEGDVTSSSSNSSSGSSSSSSSTTNSTLNATKMGDSSFNHGSKPKSNQKYIMLHDTEMSQDAKTVVQSWKNAGSGVAAHFVVDRDGTIIQAVELDTIAHHAGWGGPGNYDAKFGVGNNDGKGNGDDLVGTSKSGYANYTSYGMNSYSIGIEMCHVGGESYPAAQLEAVDKIIAYIDSYYGFKSTIIDHKDWRPSNSDTDANFATYLNNYKTLRHH